MCYRSQKFFHTYTIEYRNLKQMIKGPHVSSIVCHTLSIEVSHISIEVKIIVTRKWCFEL